MSHEAKAITIKMPNNKLPLLWNNKIILQKDLFKGNVKVVKSLQFQEDVLYESRPGDFLSGDVREAIVVNRLNKYNNSCRTIVRGKTLTGQDFEKTSDAVAKLIGQSNYDTLFSALCSVISQELKIRGIYSLLTVPKSTNTFGCQVDEESKFDSASTKSTRVEMFCQTEESYVNLLKKTKVRRRTKRSQLAPYVIREEPEQKKPRRVVIPPSNFSTILKGSIKQEESLKEEFPDLGKKIFDEDSNHSTYSNNSIGRLSVLSVTTTPELINNPMGMIMANVDKVTRDSESYQKESDTLYDFDSGKITPVNAKPTLFNEPLHHVPPQQSINLQNEILKQGWHDYNTCLQQDESGHLPIHVAVLNNDIRLLKRQCLVLKIRGMTVDIPADNLTPLKMSLYQENVALTSLLLQYNADILDTDAQDITYFHITAEMSTEHLQVLLNHCRHNARKILEENEMLWKSEYANKSDADLARILLRYINGLSNEQGYTPLMMASKTGMYENVKLLVESAPEMVNAKMPTSGKTALFIAIGAACMDCTERGNKSKVVDHFRKTIEILIENGADPNAKNFDGTNANDLLTEYNIGDLSMLIANKMTYRNFGETNFDSFMLVKDGSGNLDLKKLENNKRKVKVIRNTKVTKKSPTPQQIARIPPVNSSKKPVIIKSDTITPSNSPQLIGSTKNFNKANIFNNMTKVQNVKLNTPLILKPFASKDKRKYEITIEQNNKSSAND